MICQNCGTTVPDGVSFCPHCGERMPDSSKSESKTETSPVKTSAAGASGDNASVKKAGFASAGTTTSAANSGLADKAAGLSAKISASFGGVSSGAAANANSLKRIAFIVGIIAAIVAFVPLTMQSMNDSNIESTTDAVESIEGSAAKSYGITYAVNLNWGARVGNLASTINNCEETFRELRSTGSGVDVSGFNSIESVLTNLTFLGMAGAALYLVSLFIRKDVLRLVGAGVVAAASLVAIFSAIGANGSIASCLNVLASQASSLGGTTAASNLRGYANLTYISVLITSVVALLGMAFSEGTMQYLKRQGKLA